MARFVPSGMMYEFIDCLLRDCLAAPGTTVDTPVAVGNPNKNKTCYKCQQEGHVRVSR